ncbi:hypothetical protein [Pseudomonas sp. DP-17]|uniref:hypothetical protein n=1 Tax=Pseudomonas sp. DP-17 TaxID=1580486 RepID=UPI001EFAF599|nr:hypothetical protein [Pseudomonas sp. DP-17]MCG8910743.1 hypothetical protein [Pseudomonas sp. DP-17]
MKLLRVFPVLLLTGCTSIAPAPVEVRVPVPVPCQAPAVETPRLATADLRPADDLQTKVRALLAERQQHLAYETRLRAALEACH